MLKTNIKIWIIVVIFCLVSQMFITSFPQWVEYGKNEANIEIAQREEERAQQEASGQNNTETIADDSLRDEH